MKAIRSLFLVFLIQSSNLFSQDPGSTKAIAATVQLDSVVIVATRQGFNVEDFIRLVQNDESLYLAFRNLRTASYRFETAMSFVDRRQETQATYQSIHSQTFDGNCRTMRTHNERSSGDFHKGRKRKHRYYTYELYDRLFLTHGTICGDTSKAMTETDGSAMERHVSELKTLIFRPGHRSHVPLIGKKTEIFSEDMRDLYEFKISSTEYQSQPVYVFSAVVKDEFSHRKNKTVFKELVTYFSKKDFQVLARKYSLSQHTAAYMFDVTMEVDLTRIDQDYFPEYVHYSGSWNIPTKRRESGTFAIYFSEFQ